MPSLIHNTSVPYNLRCNLFFDNWWLKILLHSFVVIKLFKNYVLYILTGGGEFVLFYKNSLNDLLSGSVSSQKAVLRRYNPINKGHRSFQFLNKNSPEISLICHWVQQESPCTLYSLFVWFCSWMIVCGFLYFFWNKIFHKLHPTSLHFKHSEDIESLLLC